MIRKFAEIIYQKFENIKRVSKIHKSFLRPNPRKRFVYLTVLIILSYYLKLDYW